MNAPTYVLRGIADLFALPRHRVAACLKAIALGIEHSHAAAAAIGARPAWPGFVTWIDGGQPEHAIAFAESEPPLQFHIGAGAAGGGAGPALGTSDGEGDALTELRDRFGELAALLAHARARYPGAGDLQAALDLVTEGMEEATQLCRAARQDGEPLGPAFDADQRAFVQHLRRMAADPGHAPAVPVAMGLTVAMLTAAQNLSEWQVGVIANLLADLLPTHGEPLLLPPGITRADLEAIEADVIEAQLAEGEGAAPGARAAVAALLRAGGAA